MASMDMRAIRTVSGNQPAMRRVSEKLTQTFALGVPVQVDLTVGAVQEWDGTTILRGIAGIAAERGSNLTATGIAQTAGEAGVPNQPLARKIYRGAPLNDGRVGFYVANRDTVFQGQVGPAQTTAVTDIGKQYGMTKDTDGRWFVDKTKTTIGTNTVVTVAKLDAIDVARGVHFFFTDDAIQSIV